MLTTHNMSRLTIFVICLVILLPTMLSAVSNGALLFLLIEPGSKPGSLGKAFVAQADDAFAGYWNPGAMAFNRKTQIALMHTNWFGSVDGIDDMYYEYLGWNQYFDEIGNIGASVTYMTYGEQQEIDEDQVLLGTFTSYELAFAMHYGYQLFEKLGLGMNFKFIVSDLAPPDAAGIATNQRGRGFAWGFDLAMQYRDLLIDNLDFGWTIQNIGPNVTYVDEAQSDPMPIMWRMGLSYRPIDSKLNKLTINADYHKELENEDFVLARLVTAWFDDDFSQEIKSTIFSVGAEYVYYDMISLRGGYIYDRAGSFKCPSFGAGIHHVFRGIYKINLDFAYEQAGELTDYNRTYSISVEF
ncbi:MAG: PorV/PorQ family protein [Candidatus Cloacimonetes bacterium]|nr:PorV/PorQ family protein [Candidatus Cloacimonadota bacterium]